VNDHPRSNLTEMGTSGKSIDIAELRARHILRKRSLGRGRPFGQMVARGTVRAVADQRSRRAFYWRLPRGVVSRFGALAYSPSGQVIFSGRREWETRDQAVPWSVSPALSVRSLITR
jgi:hypothetical protein